MLVSNLETAPGHRVTAHLGIAQGRTGRAKHAGKDILAGLTNLVGAVPTAYPDLMLEPRAAAVPRRPAAARALGANAVLNVRFVTTSITAGAAEILAYGSAVTIEPL